MSSLVIQIAEEELKRSGNLASNAQSIDFEDVSFKKGPTFPLEMYEKALAYCEKFSVKQLKSLIVKNKYSLTIWNQQQTSVLSDQDAVTAKTGTEKSQEQAAKVEFTENSEQGQAAPNKVPTKTVIRRYRGQTYEVQVPDYSAMQQQLSNKQKTRRKYRGQYID